MTPKEKALDLFEKYLTPNLINPLYGVLGYKDAKQCALITINEILSVLEYGGLWIYSEDDTISDRDFWQEVKAEIEKL
jgi:hypothetical protein